MSADALTAAASEPQITVLVIVVLGAVVAVLGSLLWWFIRDRMKAIDGRMKDKEEEQDRRITDMLNQFDRWFVTQEKRDLERKEAYSALEKERHQAVLNHYNTIETRLQGGHKVFDDLRNGLKEANERQAAAFVALETRVNDANTVWKQSAEDLRKSFLEAQLKFVARPEFDKFRDQRDDDRRKRDAEFAKLQKSQDDLISEVRSLRTSFDATVKTLNAAVGRLMDKKLAEAGCGDATG